MSSPYTRTFYINQSQSSMQINTINRKNIIKYTFLTGICLSILSFGVFLYRKYIHYTFSIRVMEYIEEIKECLLRSTYKNILTLSNIQLELYCLILLCINEYSNEKIIEENEEEIKKRREVLKKIYKVNKESEEGNDENDNKKILKSKHNNEDDDNDDNNNDEDYTSYAYRHIKNKETKMEEGFYSILDSIQREVSSKLNKKIIIKLDFNEFMNHIKNVNAYQFKTLMGSYKKYFVPENEDELMFYKRMKISMEKEESYTKFISFYVDIINNESQLIHQKKGSNSQVTMSEENIMLLCVNHLLVKDLVYITYGISIEDFIYLIENSSLYQENTELYNEYNKLDYVDRFVFI